MTDLQQASADGRAWTPGPWKAVDDEHPQGQPAPYYVGLVCYVERSGERTTAVVADKGYVPSRQWAANAALIAAAPDLYEATRELRDRLLAFVGALALSTDCSADVEAIERTKTSNPAQSG